MSSQTHARGIDLGTTNSGIAELRGTEVHVFRNIAGKEYTASAVYMDREKSLVVGEAAKDRCESDPENAFMEFKRDMGSDTERCFARTGRRMKPQELSAEVLKSLCGDVQRATGRTVNAAVITVPADFDLPQNKATTEAAALAGIRQTVLLTEPVAAAQAYSFDSQEDKTFWLVYDFGGGTFDAAIIQVRDGLIQVVGHRGNNHLGGKNIDWMIVEKLFLPVLKDRKLTDFRRGAPQWRRAFAQLKGAAERAKILLSGPTTTSIEVPIDFLCKDDRGEPVDFDFVLKRSDLESIAAPLIRNTINLCKEELTTRRLSSANIGKLILVGGPTMMPYLRQMLQDPKEGLGIPLEFSVDPMTVVARGAAVFAASQRIGSDDEVVEHVPAGQFMVKLEYAPVGPDPDPEVAGTVLAGGGVERDFGGCTIEFINPGVRPPWRSGKVGLSPKGTFLTNVFAEKGRENKFEIELCDAQGALQTVTPNSFEIVVKGAGVIEDPRHSHNLGVALADNNVLVIYKKETPLPIKHRADLHTAVPLKKGQSGQLIRVPVVEGEKRRADRNRLVGTLTISAEKIVRDVPAGSEIEITIEIDKSTGVRTSAFIPILGDEAVFEEPMQLVSASPDAKDLVAESQKAKDRLKDLRQKAESTRDGKALTVLQRIDGECMVPEVEGLVGPAAFEADAARQCQNVLNRLNSSLDDVEDALEWPGLVEQTEKKLASAGELVKTDKYANGEDQRIFAILEREAREAIELQVPDLLRRRLESLSTLTGEIVRRDPGFWVHWFTEVKKDQDKMQDPAQAERLSAKGDRAIHSGDVAGLKDVVLGLWRLLPLEARPESISDVGL